MPYDVPAVCDRLGWILREAAPGFVAVVVARAIGTAGDRDRQVCAMVRAALAEHGVPLRAMLVVGDGRWQDLGAAA